MNIKETLETIGFSEKEQKIYLYLLKEGPSSQQKIADKTGILRQTIYEQMKKMSLKGQITISIKGKRKIYSALEPKLLLNQMKEKEEELKKIIPKLEQLSQPSEEVLTSQTFIGIKGLKNLFNLTLESKTEILWIANQKIHNKIFNKYFWDNYAQKRKEKKINIKLLIEPRLKNFWETNKQLLRETRKHELVKELKTSIIIFDNKTIIYSQKKDEMTGILIENKEITNFFKKIFEDYWFKAKK